MASNMAAIFVTTLMMNLAFAYAMMSIGGEQGVWKMSYLQQNSRALLTNIDSNSTHPFPGIELPADYNMHEVPWTDDGGPVKVNFSINLSSILAIDEPKQSISLEATIRVVWYDKRIKVHIDNASDYTSTQQHPPTPLYVDTKDRFILFNRDPVEKFWFPDIFIQKAQETRVPIYRIPPVYLRIYETGQMMYSARVNFDVSCPMSFGKYPVDIQECPIQLESWGHPAHVLRFFWNREDCVVQQSIKLNQHNFQVVLEDQEAGSNFSTGSFSSVTLRIILTRQLTYHLMRTYLPSILFVMVAWFSMFVPLNHVPGRVAMSMTTMLTLSSMFSSLTTITPPISYATKLDTWMVMCIVFVFGTLFEFTVVIFLKYYLKYLPYINVDVFSTPTPSGGKTKVLDIKSQVQAWMKNDGRNRENLVRVLKIHAKQDKKERDSDDDELDSEDEEERLEARKEFGERIIRKIEKWSVIVYLCLFICFNIYYWCDLYMVYEGEVENAKILGALKVSD